MVATCSQSRTAGALSYGRTGKTYRPDRAAASAARSSGGTRAHRNQLVATRATLVVGDAAPRSSPQLVARPTVASRAAVDHWWPRGRHGTARGCVEGLAHRGHAPRCRCARARAGRQQAQGGGGGRVRVRSGRPRCRRPRGRVLCGTGPGQGSGCRWPWRRRRPGGWRGRW